MIKAIRKYFKMRKYRNNLILKLSELIDSTNQIEGRLPHIESTLYLARKIHDSSNQTQQFLLQNEVADTLKNIHRKVDKIAEDVEGLKEGLSMVGKSVMRANSVSGLNEKRLANIQDKLLALPRILEDENE